LTSPAADVKFGNQLVTSIPVPKPMARARASIDVFHAVADPTRRAILDRLQGGGVAVAELAAGFAMSRPAVSKHLRVLRDARLVREDKEGRRRIYRLTPAPLRDLSLWVEAYRSFWAANLMSLKRHLEGGKESNR
jgi:DNA-binding transcriptional ArsR family regulator